jgi:UDP:flavonoid glycosyltransferase YjiC (YdhE family)
VRVLFTTRGSSGHLGPMVPFARALLGAGHEVAVAAQRQMEANVKRAGLAFVPFDDPPREEWMPLLEQFGELDVESADKQMIGRFFAGVDVRAGLPGLRAAVESLQPQAIVRESWEFGSTLVAELHGIPLARIGLGLAEVEQRSIELAAPELEAPRAALGLEPDPVGERLRAAPYLTMMPEVLEDPAAAAPGRTHRFRFGASEPASPLPDWWPGNDDPLVYLTFGSVTAGAHLPYYPELYRAAIEAIASLPVRVLVTSGDFSRDLAELGPVPDNVHLETWVAHDEVAPVAATIVCHGGYGSTLGALAHAVPLVVLPLFSADQWANGDAVARAGAGISLAGERGTRRVLALPSADTMDHLPGAVRQAIDDRGFAQGARRIAQAIDDLPPVQTAVETLAAIAAGEGDGI